MMLGVLGTGSLFGQSLPVLLQPTDGSVLGHALPTLVWSPATGGATVRYRVRVVERMGQQTCVSAIQSNPVYYQSELLTGTVFTYPFTAPALVGGRWYCWQVEVLISEPSSVGYSEVASFYLSEDSTLRLRREHLDSLKRVEDPFIYAAPQKTRTSYGYVTYGERLFFKYVHPGGDSLLRFVIEDERGQPVLKSPHPLEGNSSGIPESVLGIKPGINFLVLDLKGKGLRYEGHYTLKINASRSEMLYLNFVHLDPEGKVHRDMVADRKAQRKARLKRLKEVNSSEEK